MKKADGTLKDPLETSPPPLAHGLAVVYENGPAQIMWMVTCIGRRQEGLWSLLLLSGFKSLLFWAPSWFESLFHSHEAAVFLWAFCFWFFLGHCSNLKPTQAEWWHRRWRTLRRHVAAPTSPAEIAAWPRTGATIARLGTRPSPSRHGWCAGVKVKAELGILMSQSWAF